MRALAARSDLGWLVLTAIAALAAMHTIFDWAAIIASDAPIGYGEGAVAHAGQLLARGRDPYGLEPAGTFVSANYPPLAYAVEAIGATLGPFTALRVVNVTACVAIATVATLRARGSRLAAIAIGGSFLALYPVAVWGGSARVDPLAVALTAFSVVTASADPRRATIAGVLAALALAAQPTARRPLVARWRRWQRDYREGSRRGSRRSSWRRCFSSRSGRLRHLISRPIQHASRPPGRLGRVRSMRRTAAFSSLPASSPSSM